MLIFVDGCEGSAVLVQPTGIILKGTLCARDTGVGSVKLGSPISPLVRCMETVNSMMRVFGIHHKFPAGLQETIKSQNDTVAYLNDNNNNNNNLFAIRIQCEVYRYQ